MLSEESVKTALPALLHDIGKVSQRAGKYDGHEEASAAFVDEFKNLFLNPYLVTMHFDYSDSHISFADSHYADPDYPIDSDVSSRVHPIVYSTFQPTILALHSDSKVNIRCTPQPTYLLAFWRVKF